MGKRILITCILLALSMPAFAVGKVTTDPNAGGSAAAPVEMLDDSDARLSKLVTVSETQIQVWKLMDELTKSTGVVFKAGSGGYDWQVRDRKMNVFAKDIPLVQLMNSISHVMKFKWERKGEAGKWTYRLYMDRRTLLDAEAQRSRAEEKQKAEQTARRQNALDTYGKMSSMTDAEKAKLRNDNPFLYAVSKTGWGDALGAFFREVPSVADALASGQKVNLDAASLTPAARVKMINAMRAELALENRFSGGQSTSRSLPDTLDPATVSLSVNRNLDQAPMPIQGVFLGGMDFGYDGKSMEIPFVNPDSQLIKWLGNIMIESEQSGQSTDEIMKNRQGEMAAMLTSEVKSEAGGEPEIEHPQDPTLDAKVTLKPESAAIFNVELELAAVSKLAVVSDYFATIDWQGMGGPTPLTGEMDLKTALQKLADSYVYNWDKKGQVIELRDRNWFRKRTLQIPDAWLDKWRDELKSSGSIGIDSLAQVAQLTQEQINANINGDEDLRRSSLASNVASSREVLRFYASLTADQRASLASASGLDLRALSPDQRGLTNKLMDTRASIFSSAKTITMTLQNPGTEKGDLYDFQLTADNTPAGHWYVSPAHAWKPLPVDPKKTPPAAPKPAK